MVALLAGLTACAAAPKHAHAPALPVNAVQHAIAHTVYLEDSGCSAVQVAVGTLVTAKHCLPDDAEAGDEYEGGIVGYVAPRDDFAVIITGLELANYIPMRPGQIGEHVYVVGYPVQLGDRKQALTVTDGIVAGPSNPDQQERITAPVYFGNSGGGVWSADGALIGIAVSIYGANIDGYRYPMPYTAQSFMVPISRVLAVLD